MTHRTLPLLGGKYEIVRELGAGGFATVYLAREVAGDLSPDRLVAIKVLREDGALTEAKLRFSQEIRVMANLRHPHIVPLFDTGVWDDRPYLVMPYIEGENLATRIAHDGKLAPRPAVRMAIQLCEALAYAHEHHIVHRDVKPSNVIFDTSGNAWLADFGVARWTELTGDERLTRSSAGAPATMAYASPEQLAGARHLDGRSDIYSLGVVLFETLTGVLPFGGAPSVDAMRRRFGGDVPSVRELRPDVDQALSDMVGKCLALNPMERWETAGQAREALLQMNLVGSLRWLVPPWAPRAAWLAGAAGALVAVVTLATRSGPAAPAGVGDLPLRRLAVTRFERQVEGLAPGIELRLRDALGRWEGIDIAIALSAVTGRSGVTWDGGEGKSGRADLAVTGELRETNGKMHLTARLLEQGPTVRMLRAVTTTIAASEDDTTLARIAESLLMPETARGRGIRSYLVGQALADGLASIGAWNLPAADSALTRALGADPRLAAAAIWLAQVRIWRERPLPEWSFLPSRANGNAAHLTAREHGYVGPLVRQAAGAFAEACDGWRRLAQADDGDFAAWFGLSHCLRSDNLVLAGGGGRLHFRSSHNAALHAYRHALELVPVSHPRPLRPSPIPRRPASSVGASRRRPNTRSVPARHAKLQFIEPLWNSYGERMPRHCWERRSGRVDKGTTNGGGTWERCADSRV